MDLLNKARRKAEAAINELQSLAADPDKKRAQYQGHNSYQTSNPNAPGYVGSGPVQWEQHQQNFSHRPPPPQHQQSFPTQYQHQYQQHQPPQQSFHPTPPPQFHPGQGHRYSVSSAPPSHGQPQNYFSPQPGNVHHHGFSPPPPPHPQSPPPPPHMTSPMSGYTQFSAQPLRHDQRHPSISYQNHPAVQTSSQGHSQFTPLPQRPQSMSFQPMLHTSHTFPNAHPHSQPQSHSQSPPPPPAPSMSPSQFSSNQAFHNPHAPPPQNQTQSPSPASMSPSQFSSNQEFHNPQPTLPQNQSQPPPHPSMSPSQYSTPNAFHGPQSSPPQNQSQPLAPPSMNPSQYPTTQTFQPPQSPPPPPVSPPIPNQLWHSQTFPNAYTQSHSSSTSTPPLPQSQSPTQQRPFASVPERPDSANAIALSGRPVSPPIAQYSAQSQHHMLPPVSPSGTQPHVFQNSPQGPQGPQHQISSPVSELYKPYNPYNPQQSSPPTQHHFSLPIMPQNESHSPPISPPASQLRIPTQQLVDDLDSQMAALKLPTEQSRSQDALPVEIDTNGLGQDGRGLSPAPLQLRPKRHEMAAPTSFAVELPGCSTFSSPPSRQDPPPSFAVELSGSHTFISSPPSELPDPETRSRAPNSSISHESSSFPSELLDTETRSSTLDSSISHEEVPQQSLDCIGSSATFTKHHQFYVLIVSPDFAICTPCYHFKVKPKALICSHFAPYKGDDVEMICDMSFPRVQGVFKSQCIPLNSTQPLLDFARLLPELTACTGSMVSSPGPMFVTKGLVIPGFAVCSTCYELYIKHTDFERYFESKTYLEVHEWTCDFAMPYFEKMFQSELKKETPDFALVANEAKGRLQMPACPGEGKPIGRMADGNCLVLTSAGGKAGNICPACYCDRLTYTSLEKDFVAANLGPAQIGTITCDLAGDYSKVAMGVAIKRSNIELWRRAVGFHGKLSPCAGARGVDEAELKLDVTQKGDLAQWYQMKDYPKVECCPCCYYQFVALYGAEHLQSPITRQLVAGKVRQCFWTDSAVQDNTSAQETNSFDDTTVYRGIMLRNRLERDYETGDFSDLFLVAKIFDEQPRPCAGNLRGFKKASGRKFFGHIAENRDDPEDTTIVLCEECHSNIIAGTPLASSMSQDLTEMAYEAADPVKGFFCQPYSRRARQNLKEAAKAGKLAQFAKYWNNREELRKKREAWQPILAQQDAKQKAYNNNLSNSVLLKVNAQSNALMRIGGAMVHEASMGETGVRYGNSTIGMNHLTAGRADAEMAMHIANNMPTGGGGDIVAESKTLLALFQRDNDAFLAVE